MIAVALLVRRRRSWNVFERRYTPLCAPNHDYLWEPGEIPADPDPRFWWTVVESEGRLSLIAGFHLVNRFAFVHCAKPWTGDERTHPDYAYD